jgi:dihydroorotate dehydrogenase (fumarate)
MAQSIIDLAKAGIGGVVMKTLFQCQTRCPRPQPLYELRLCGKNEYISHVFHSYEPGIHTLETYKRELKNAAHTVDIPVIASISCSEISMWEQYAKECVEAGAAMIELNVSCPVLHGDISTMLNPNELGEVVAAVRSTIKIPICVKLSPRVESPITMAQVAKQHGANAVVLFNKFAGLDIDVENEAPISHQRYTAVTGPWFSHIVLRWITSVSRSVDIDVCGTGGIFSGVDIVKYLLCGACCVQFAGSLYMTDQTSEVIKMYLDGLNDWMSRRRYNCVSKFIGKISTSFASPYSCQCRYIRNGLNK